MGDIWICLRGQMFLSWSRRQRWFYFCVSRLWTLKILRRKNDIKRHWFAKRERSWSIFLTFSIVQTSQRSYTITVKFQVLMALGVPWHIPAEVNVSDPKTFTLKPGDIGFPKGEITWKKRLIHAWEGNSTHQRILLMVFWADLTKLSRKPGVDGNQLDQYLCDPRSI